MVDKYICMMDGCSYISQDKLDALAHAKLGEEHVMVEIMANEEDVRCRMMETNLDDVI